MVSWIIIVVLLIAVILLVKAKHLKHKMSLIVLVIFVIFFYTTASVIIRNNNIDTGSLNGISQFTQIYFNWFIHVASNVKSLAGNAINMDWQGNVSNALTNSSIGK